jgi:hypothetical protein
MGADTSATHGECYPAIDRPITRRSKIPRTGTGRLVTRRTGYGDRVFIVLTLIGLVALVVEYRPHNR